jgi:hypothetical protein
MDRLEQVISKSNQLYRQRKFRLKSGQKIPIYFQDFLMADCPVCFFIRIWVTDHAEVQWQRDISLKNAKTHERLVIKKVAHNPIRVFNERLRLISRYPLGAAKQWVETNEEAVLDWKFWDQCRQISLGSHIKNTIRKKRKNNKKSTKNDMHILNNV